MEKSKLKEFINSPRKSLMLISLPVIAAGIVETLYNLVDTYFVAKLGADSLAAMTYSWPFFFLLIALSLGLNAGITSRISRSIGEKRKKDAENAAMHGILLAFILSTILLSIGFFTLPFFLTISGATGAALSQSIIYMRIILVGAIFMFVSYSANAIFSAQGDTTTAMKIDIYSLLINIILCPIFIFWFKLGIAGAALATTVSVIFATIQSAYYFKTRSYLKISFKKFRYNKRFIKEIFEVASPSSIMMVLMALSSIFLNRIVSHFDVNHVAAFGVVARLESVAVLPIYGISVGALTIAGMFYGAKKYHLLKDITWFSMYVGIAISSFVGLILFIFSKEIISFFTSDPLVLAAAVPFMRFDVFTFPAMGIMMVLPRVMQAMGLGMPGLVITLIRLFLVSIPLSYLFVFYFNFSFLSIAFAMIISSIISAIIGVIWMQIELKKHAVMKNDEMR